jgi:hypothetical protein
MAPFALIRNIARVAVASVLLTGACFAAEPKPDIAIKTNAVDISVTLDATIKANPALKADCLAEGKRYAENQRKETTDSKRSDPKYFPNGGYTFERHYVTASAAGGRYISILREDYADTHGAHPNTYVDTILWDDTAKKRLSIRPFFKETADGGPTLTAMRKAVIAALKAEKKQRGIVDDDGAIDWYENIGTSLLKIGSVTLEPSTEPGKSSGLAFHYEPYAVGPYAEGRFDVVVPWQELKSHLTAEGTTIFGGAPPKRDDNNQR